MANAPGSSLRQTILPFLFCSYSALVRGVSWAEMPNTTLSSIKKVTYGALKNSRAREKFLVLGITAQPTAAANNCNFVIFRNLSLCTTHAPAGRN